jgi:hypothetical protein
MDGEPDGAWSTGELCPLVYGRGVTVTREQRRAVRRAVQTMPLPKGWSRVRGSGPRDERYLYNACSVASASKAFGSSRVEYIVAHARRLRDAKDEAARIDEEIENLSDVRIDLFVEGYPPEVQKQARERMRQLLARRAELLPGRIQDPNKQAKMVWFLSWWERALYEATHKYNLKGK